MWFCPELGKPCYPVPAYRELVGDGLAMLFQRALPECENDAALKEDCMHRFEQAYAKCWNNRSKPYDGIDTLLKKLSERSVSLSVLSNKADAFTKQCVSHFFRGTRFRPCFGAI